ncbi:MAG: M14 family zinc carboxypeptidase [Pseudomonadota bacterium]
MQIRLLAVMATAFALTATVAIAQTATSEKTDVREVDANMFPPDTLFDVSIPTPADFLGFKLGHEPVRHHQLVDYLRHVAELSDRLTVETIGYSHERRPILFLVATSPENRERIDEIRAQHIALTEPGGGQDTTKGIADDMPVVTWLNYGVHGAEASGMDASLPFVYHLAAAQGEAIERVLDESVILVTAVFNPDGHSQRISWEDAYGGKRRIADPAHIEHASDWRFARTNHYFFDLNRQWLLLTQPEPRAWMRKWHEWRPNLTVDYHEMGSDNTYYFHPGVATRTNPLAPDRAEELMAQVVRTSEDFLDSEGRLYYHGEGFDNFYVGKGSTFPLVNGGVGILYEASSTRGREIETQNGLRTFRENIRKQYRTSVASIEGAVALRQPYLEYQRDFYRSALDEAADSSTRAWVFSAPGDPARMHFFADLLNYHRISTYRLARDVDAGGKSFSAAESLVVPVSQPQYRLIRSIFETLTEFEDATFYDVSTWALPPAFGLDYAALAGGAFSDSLVGGEYAPAMPVANAPVESTYGYVFEWGPYHAPRALQRVLESEMLARVATKPINVATTSGDRSFPVGSIIVPLDRQERPAADIYELMKTIAAEDGVAVHAMTSGRSTTGSADVNVGGPAAKSLKPVHALLAVGNDVNLYDAGEIWHLADFRMNMPITLRARDDLGGIEWERYTHIVFPSGDYDGFEPEWADRMRTWVDEGGTVIGMRESVSWVRSNTIDWIDPTDLEAVEAAKAEAEEKAAEEEEAEESERLAYEDKADFEAERVIGGAIFAADLDNSHPLGFGYADRAIFLHKNVEDPMETTENPFGTVIAYTDDPVYSGYVSEENSDELAGTPALIAERSGDGSVILFADNPNFRGYWYGTNKLFLNALFFSTAFDAPQED